MPTDKLTFRHVAEESLILMGEIEIVDIHKSRIFVLSAKVRLCAYMRKDRKKAGPPVWRTPARKAHA